MENHASLDMPAGENHERPGTGGCQHDESHKCCRSKREVVHVVIFLFQRMMFGYLVGYRKILAANASCSSMLDRFAGAN
jgi:hypothetical protein